MKTLAVRYRPRTFEDVVEQDAIKKILGHQVETGTHKNSYLFVGSAGTGKTTCARIFARDLNGGSGEPIEIDAASNNSVDDVRELIERAKFKSLEAKHKVFIIDECHMLSASAWNAMLKILEEPPAMTIFVMCTTDPQKIPKTILSRVQRYDFRRISTDGIMNRLERILADLQEEDADTTADAYAIEYLAKLANGGLRDAITMFDKVLSYDKNVTVATVVATLGTVDYDEMFDLHGYLVSCDHEALIEFIGTAHDRGVDLKSFVHQFIDFELALLKRDITGDWRWTSVPSLYEEKMPDDLLTWDDINLLFLLQGDIKWEAQPRPLIENVLMSISRGYDE